MMKMENFREWDTSLLLRARRQGMRVWSVDELEQINKELTKRKNPTRKKKPVASKGAYGFTMPRIGFRF